MTKRGRPRNIVLDKTNGKGMTINQFVKQGAKEMQRLYLTRSAIIKRKLLTKNALDIAIETGELNGVIYKEKRYISREELHKFLNSKHPTVLF